MLGEIHAMAFRAFGCDARVRFLKNFAPVYAFYTRSGTRSRLRDVLHDPQGQTRILMSGFGCWVRQCRVTHFTVLGQVS